MCPAQFICPANTTPRHRLRLGGEPIFFVLRGDSTFLEEGKEKNFMRTRQHVEVFKGRGAVPRALVRH